ncbi:MAG: hypothetical protein JWR32_5981 [Mycobacterium sp.]|jgi:hypothetical protein|nr:hypothetical protein [Mycobacterium sp.]
MAAAEGLIDAAEATPTRMRSCSRFSPMASLSATPIPTARDAQDSGNRSNETHLASTLCRLEAKYGDPLAAYDYVSLAIRNYHDSGNTTLVRSPLAIVAALFDRLGRHEPAATIAGFAFSPLTAASVPELNGRDHPPARCPRRPSL